MAQVAAAMPGRAQALWLRDVRHQHGAGPPTLSGGSSPPALAGRRC